VVLVQPETREGHQQQEHARSDVLCIDLHGVDFPASLTRAVPAAQTPKDRFRGSCHAGTVARRSTPRTAAPRARKRNPPAAVNPSRSPPSRGIVATRHAAERAPSPGAIGQHAPDCAIRPATFHEIAAFWRPLVRIIAQSTCAPEARTMGAQ
jgi:hypothetical protein